MGIDIQQLGQDVVKLIGGVALGGGAMWTAWTSWRRRNRVDNSKATTDIVSFGAYDGTIQGLQADISRLRKTMEEDANTWAAKMTQYDARLQTMSDQVDAAITARRKAEDDAARLRFQLRGAGLEPVV